MEGEVGCIKAMLQKFYTGSFFKTFLDIFLFDGGDKNVWLNLSMASAPNG